MNLFYSVIVFFFVLIMMGCSKKPIEDTKFNAQGSVITDFSGIVKTDSIPILVSNLPNNSNSKFGLSEVCINIQHKRVSDLKISLLSPNGTEVWLSNRNGNTGRNYTSTCFSNEGFSGFIHQGVAPFSGQFIPDGRLSFFNDGQNPNGEWNLLVRDLKSEFGGTIDYVSLKFSSDPKMDMVSRCDEKNPESCKCNGDSDNCTLLPDLVMLPSFTENQIKEYAQDDPNYPGQLRFAASIANIGYGPLEIFGRNEWFCGNENVNDGNTVCPDGKFPRQIIYQKIYYKSSKSDSLIWNLTQANTNYYDDKPGHDHFHVDDWVEFRLLEAKSNKLVSKGRKISFCLFDTGICAGGTLCEVDNINYSINNLTNYGFGSFGKCNSKIQGISVGGYDTYGLFYEGQFLTIPPNTQNGQYFLEIEIDPDNHYLESIKTNNILRVPVNLSKQLTN